MKKYLTIPLLLILGFLLWVYCFIPDKLTINEHIVLNAHQNTVNRALNSKALWKQWWPVTADSGLLFNQFTFEPRLPGMYVFNIKATDETEIYSTQLSVVESSAQSVVLFWKAALSAGNNPVTRISRYSRFKKLERSIQSLLQAANRFLSAPKNIYGIKITNQQVKDTLLLNTQTILAQRPTTPEVYALISKLENAAKNGGAAVTGYPMLNISNNNQSGYLVRVALPVSKPVRENNGIVVKRMIPGNILVSDDITGGPGTTMDAFRQMMNYAQDIGKTMPAIPYQSLITNRMQERDSTKWITRIYCPVI